VAAVLQSFFGRCLYAFSKREENSVMTMGYRMGDVDARGATLRAPVIALPVEQQAIVRTMPAKAHTARGNMSNTETAIGSSWVEH
jgi:hypothetical protein